MSDKFRKTAPLDITFADAEQPTGQKLTALASQARNALGLLEQAIGDVWTQSGDAILTSYPLQIPNIARLIGENRYLNPALYPFQYEFVFTEAISDKFTGLTSGYLLFKPKTGGTITSDTGGDAFSGNLKTYEYEVGDPNNDSPGSYEWWVSEETGKFRCDDVITAGDAEIIYTVDPADESENSEETLPGIIPDPRQTEFTSCRIEESGGLYYLHIPPRRPLTFAATPGG